MATHWAIREPGGTYFAGCVGTTVWFGNTEEDAVRWGTKWAAQEMLESSPSDFHGCVVVKLTSEVSR